MADPGPTGPAQLLREWQQLLRNLASAGTSLPGQPDIVRQLVGGMQRQAEQFQAAIEKQVGFQQQILRGLFEPMNQVQKLLDEAIAPMRKQVDAFNQAAAAMKQIAELLEMQVSLVERANAAFRQPGDVMRTMLGAGTSSKADEGKPGS